MFAPPDVDSDESSGEDITPPPTPSKPPPAKLGFFLRALISATKSPGKAQEKEQVKGLTPIQAAEELSAPDASQQREGKGKGRPPTPLKKKVRIRVEGEEENDKPLDLLESPAAVSPIDAAEENQANSDTPESSPVEKMGLGALSPLGPGRKPDQVAGEVLGLLRQLIAESAVSAAASRRTSPPLSASLEPVDDTDDNQTQHQHSPQPTIANSLGLSGTSPRPRPRPTVSQYPGGVKKKNSKMGLFTKLVKLSSPKKSSPSQGTYDAPPMFSPPQYQSPTQSRPDQPSHPTQTQDCTPNSASKQSQPTYTQNGNDDTGHIRWNDQNRPQHGLNQDYYQSFASDQAQYGHNSNYPTPHTSQPQTYARSQHRHSGQTPYSAPPISLSFPIAQPYQDGFPRRQVSQTHGKTVSRGNSAHYHPPHDSVQQEYSPLGGVDQGHGAQQVYYDQNEYQYDGYYSAPPHQQYYDYNQYHPYPSHQPHYQPPPPPPPQSFHPPPFYPHPPSLQPWQPNHPTQVPPHYPSYYAQHPYGTYSSYPYYPPASQSAPPAHEHGVHGGPGEWVYMPNPWDPRYPARSPPRTPEFPRQSTQPKERSPLDQFAKMESQLEADGLELKTASGEAQSPVKTTLMPVTGSVKGEIGRTGDTSRTEDKRNEKKVAYKEDKKERDSAKQGMISPKIVMSSDGAFKEVEAYPEAQASQLKNAEKVKEIDARDGKENVPKSPPPQYHSKDEEPRLPFAQEIREGEKPNRVNLEDGEMYEGKRKQIAQMTEQREKGKAREKAAEGKLAPEDVDTAVHKAAKGHTREGPDDNEETGRSAQDVKKGKAHQTFLQGVTEGGEGADEQVQLLKDKMGQIKRQREKIMTKIMERSVDKEKGRTELQKLEKLMKQIEEELCPSTKGIRDNDGQASSKPEVLKTKSTVDSSDTQKQVEMIKRLMVKIKMKVADGSMEKEEGKMYLERLMQERTKQEKSATLEEFKSDTMATMTSGKAFGEDPAADKAGKNESRVGNALEKNKQNMMRLKTKMSEGSMSKEEGEKVMKRLMKERDNLKKKVATDAEGSEVVNTVSSTKSKSIPGEPGKMAGKSREMAQEGESEELDPEILKEILTGPTTAAPFSTSPQQEEDHRMAFDSQDMHHDPSLSSKVDLRSDKEGRRVESMKRAQMLREEKRARAEGRSKPIQVPGQYLFPTAHPLPYPPKPLSQKPTGPETNLHMSPPPSALGTTSGGALAQPVIPPRSDLRPFTVDPESLSWSKCLVSLAACIDLANKLLTHVASRHRPGAGTGNIQEHPIMVEILPRLLTSLLMQRDMVTMMKGVFGEEHSDAMEEFMGHLGVVQGFLVAQQHNHKEISRNAEHRHLGSMEGRLSEAFEMGSLQVVLEHLLHVSDLLTPGTLTALRNLLYEWKKDGFSISTVVKTVITVQRELSTASKAKAIRENNGEVEEQAGGVMSVLDKLLALLGKDASGEHDMKENSPAHLLKPSLPGRLAEQLTESRAIPPVTSSTTRPTEHSGLRQRLGHLVEVVGAKLDPGHNQPEITANESIQHTEAIHPLRVITEDFSPSKTKTGNNREKHPKHLEPNLHLPPAIQDFLNEDHTTRASEHVSKYSQAREEKLHNVEESTLVRPPGPASGAEGTSHEVRRPSNWSSDSFYSEASDGTVESDDDARELLATADSGPAKVEEESSVNEEEGPSVDQVRRAREVLRGHGEVARRVTVVKEIE